MTRTYLLRSILLAACSSLALAPDVAEAYCRANSARWALNTPIRVVIHDQLDEQMLHGDGTVWTRAEVELAVNWALTRLNESAGADVPYVYLDATGPAPTCPWYDVCDDIWGPPWPGCAQANTIVIVPSNCEKTAIHTQANNADVMMIQTSFATIGQPNSLRWDHEPGVAAVFENTLLHEFGHSLGLGHPENDLPTFAPICTAVSVSCPPGATACAVMSNDQQLTWANDLFAWDDANGLRALYGARVNPDRRLFESGDLDLGAVEWGLGVMDSTGYYAASSQPAAPQTSVTVASYWRSFTTPGRLIAYSWDWNTLGLTWLGGPTTSLPATGPIGAAQSTTTRFVAGHVQRMTGDFRHTRRRVLQGQVPLAGSPWTTLVNDPANGVVADTVVAGVSSVFDPISGAVIHAFRADDGRVLLLGNRSGTWSNVIDSQMRSFSTPQLACLGDGILVGTETPRPVTTSRSTRLMWREFYWSQTGSVAAWSPGALHTDNDLMYGNFTIAAVPHSGWGFEFVITHGVPAPFSGGFGTITWLLRKRPGESQNFTVWGELARALSSRTFPTVGGTSNFVEAFLLSPP